MQLSRYSRLRVGVAFGGLLALLGITTVASEASHTTITSYDHFLWATTTWNNYKVYLSSPRHSNSRYRGECGWEENANGRHWNMYSGGSTPSVPGNDLAARGYHVVVSANARDDGWLINRTASNNWGADLHVVTHTNADDGCPDSVQYLLVMYRDGNQNSIGLKNRFISALDPKVPGGNASWNCYGVWGECAAQAPHVAYVELFFHDNQPAVDWFQTDYGNGDAVYQHSWRYGYAVDLHLGYP